MCWLRVELISYFFMDFQCVFEAIEVKRRGQGYHSASKRPLLHFPINSTNYRLNWMKLQSNVSDHLAHISEFFQNFEMILKRCLGAVKWRHPEPAAAIMAPINGKLECKHNLLSFRCCNAVGEGGGEVDRRVGAIEPWGSPAALPLWRNIGGAIGFQWNQSTGTEWRHCAAILSPNWGVSLKRSVHDSLNSIKWN